MYIAVNKCSASISDHKPLHVFKIQQEVTYNYMHCILRHTIWILLNLIHIYVSQINFNVTNKVA